MDYSNVRIDLHIHSTASDGSLPPSDIAALAVDLGIKVISLTDHDSVAGTKALLTSGFSKKLQLLSGVEISTAPPPSLKHSGSLHLLGYGFDLEDTSLSQMLEKQQAARFNRAPGIIARLNKLGVPISLADIEKHTMASQVDRPHIARWMVETGHAPSMDAVFDRYLGKGQPAYVEKWRVSVAEAISKIRAAGGLAVLAHPGLLDITDNKDFEQLFVELMSMGLQGVEVYYPRHSPAEQSFFKKLAAKLDLLVTGGSDFHGKEVVPDIELGSGTGDLHVPYTVYEAIAEKLKTQ